MKGLTDTDLDLTKQENVDFVICYQIISSKVFVKMLHISPNVRKIGRKWRDSHKCLDASKTSKRK